jgi:uncharacterized protein (DUF4415 family)
MQENNQSTKIQTSGGLENGPSSLAKEKSLEFLDAPDLSGGGFLQAVRAEYVPQKKQVSLRIDEDILDFFRQQGSRYQTKMHAVLRAYVDERTLPKRK